MEISEIRLMENRPGVFVVGSSGVGKRTLLSRLLSVGFENPSESSSQTEVHGWTINTKYYTADVSVWISHISDEYSLPNLPQSHQLVALVMVFDLNEMSTLVDLQNWVSHTNINAFDLLLCIGNKVDLIPHHLAHDDYRRRLLKITDSSKNLYSDIDEFEISKRLDIRRTCIDWCCNNNIEFIESCASNPDFDKCLSVDGDSQGIERLFDALSAHIWPGMILKSGDSEEYGLEYEVLSSDSADPWENLDERWVSGELGLRIEPEEEIDGEVVTDERDLEIENDKSYEVEDVEQLMSEIGNIRDNLRLMPDFQRREIAANLAMKMASMFGGDSDDNEESE